MTRLTPQATRLIAEVAARHAVSVACVEAMLFALAAGGGTQAQFNIPELGGMGQWSMGGMTMVGDMFNTSLKARVDSLCADLSGLMAQGGLFEARPMPPMQAAQSQTHSQSHGQSHGQPQGQSQSQSQGQSQSQSQGMGGMAASLFVSGGFSQWPQDLGAPSSSGGQNNLRYGVFPATRRLAVDINGVMTLYDTGEHQISGVSQSQSGDQSLTFISQFGTVQVAQLPVVGREDAEGAAGLREVREAPSRDTSHVAEPPAVPSAVPSAVASALPPAAAAPAPVQPPQITSDEIIALIEKLAQLHEKAILTDEEYQRKKAELLARL